MLTDRRAADPPTEVGPIRERRVPRARTIMIRCRNGSAAWTARAITCHLGASEPPLPGHPGCGRRSHASPPSRTDWSSAAWLCSPRIAARVFELVDEAVGHQEALRALLIRLVLSPPLALRSGYMMLKALLHPCEVPAVRIAPDPERLRHWQRWQRWQRWGSAGAAPACNSGAWPHQRHWRAPPVGQGWRGREARCRGRAAAAGHFTWGGQNHRRSTAASRGEALHKSRRPSQACLSGPCPTARRAAAAVFPLRNSKVESGHFVKTLPPAPG